MSEADELIEDMSELQKFIVLLLDSKNQEPISGKTSFKKELHFQKELFFIAKNIPELEKEASFDYDFYGPYSDNAKEGVKALALDEIVDDRQTSMMLSNLGKEIAEKLRKKYPKDVLELLSEIKELLNDISEDELLTLVYVTVPKYARESLIWEKLSKNRVNIAISLYKKKKISIGRAVEIADVPLEKLLKMVD